MKIDNLPDHKTMYTALVKKDSAFEGIFFAGVKTTGIFCRPTCTAKKPKRENVEFFAAAKVALSHGYRPCKVCHPVSLYGESPSWLKEFLNEIENNPAVRITAAELRKKNIEPTRIRRWFKKHHGITFQSYLRALRLNRAFGQIKHNEKIIDSAFDSGYESLSGFAEAFKKKTGFSPSVSRSEKIISITRILTPLGPMFAGAVDEGICLLEFTDRRMLETQMSTLQKKLKARLIPGGSRYFADLERQLKEYFNGDRKKFDIPLSLPGSEFQLRTWGILRSIPYGKTCSYEEQASAMGQPNAVRAAARANGENRISIIIPCHRVIAKNGKLAGYGGGLWRKQYLIDMEKKYTTM